jgi:hypothetical protein
MGSDAIVEIKQLESLPQNGFVGLQLHGRRYIASPLLRV